MTDKFLKFDSREEAEQVLFDKTDDGQLISKGDFVADIIGKIYKPTGKVLKTPDGLVPETAPISGWHVNVRGIDVEQFDAYSIEVAEPVRFWA